MDSNPWGLSGPDFLWLYIGGFAVALIALVVLRRRARTGSPPVARHRSLTLDETAYLAGGKARMVESAIAGLVERGALRVERNGYVYQVGTSGRGPETGMEKLVMQHVSTRSGMSVGQLQRRLTAMYPDKFKQTHTSLQERGLAYGGGPALIALVPMLVLFAVGVVRWVNGINLGFPVGYLTVLLVLTLVVILFALRPVKPGATTAGRALLAERDGSGGAAGLVAQRGMTAYPDKVKAKALGKRREPSRSSSGRRGGGGDGGAGGGFAFWAGDSSGGHSAGCGSSSSGSSCGGGGGCGGGGS